MNICKVCKKEFTNKDKYHKAIYCSMKCASNDPAKFTDKECGHCGKRFKAKTKRSKYCSEKCKSEFNYLERKRKGIKYERAPRDFGETSCQNCGKTFTRTSSKKQKYCSLSCVSSDKSNMPQKTSICEMCGKSFSYKAKTRALRCDSCKKIKAAEASLDHAHKTGRIKNPGVGSGGAQWGEDNSQWNPDGLYHGELRNRGYEHGYRSTCYNYYDKKCQCCGQTKGLIDVHHIDGIRDNGDPENLIPLCRKCHLHLHKRLCPKATCSQDYKDALKKLIPNYEEKIAHIISNSGCRSKTPELSGNPETGIRTEG